MTTKPEIQPWQKCPVCNGCGTVAQNFYNPDMTSAADTARKQCRTCNGRGIIATHAPERVPSVPRAVIDEVIATLKAYSAGRVPSEFEEGIEQGKYAAAVEIENAIHAAEKEQK